MGWGSAGGGGVEDLESGLVVDHPLYGQSSWIARKVSNSNFTGCILNHVHDVCILDNTLDGVQK